MEEFPKKEVRTEAGERSFDRGSRERVRKMLVAAESETMLFIDSSNLHARTKEEMKKTWQVLLTEFEDDRTVEKAWVTFKGNDIERARSTEGVYDEVNTAKYVLSELQGFLSPLFLARQRDSRQEMQQVIGGIREVFEKLLPVA